MNDIRYAIRQLLHQPAFTAIAVLTLALGIGACTAVFSVVNAVLLRPLDYSHPEQLVIIRETKLPRFPEFTVSPPNFLDWQKETKSYSALAAFTGAAFTLTGQGEPQRVAGMRATADDFKVYGVQPVLGRMFSPEEDAPGRNHVVVLSYSFWQRAFGGQKNIIGQSVQLSGEAYTVVGVGPPEFGGTYLDLWVPMAFSADEQSEKFRDSHYLNVTGRLKPGVTAEQADAELKVVAAQLAKRYPDTDGGWSAFVTPLQEYSVRDVRVVLYTLLAAVGCVLCIACANVANLLLARATSRHRELSIRSALGATRLRLIRQLLTETVLLAVCGGAAGLLVARFGLQALVAVAPPSLPRSSTIHIDATILLFALLLSILTGIVFGIVPAWFAANTNINESLKQGARGGTDTRGRLRGALVVIEIAFALMLLAMAGLLTRSFLQLTHLDLGFNPTNVTVLSLSLPVKKYEKAETKIAFANQLLERLSGLPGVESLGITTTLPPYGDWITTFAREGWPARASSELPPTGYYIVTPDYFRAMGMHLVRGRLFDQRDNAQAEPVAIISERLALQYFPNEDPLDKRIKFGESSNPWRRIVGIIGDIKQPVEREMTSQSQSYIPFAQDPFPALNVVLRTSGSSAALNGVARAAVYAVDKDQPVASIRTFTEIVATTIAKQRFAMLLLTIFSSIALVIAAVGIYGVMAFMVVQRRTEIGIRMALGAKHRDIFRLILMRGGKLVGVGVVLGLIATLVSGRAVGSMLFQTSSYDPVTLLTVTVLLAAAALVACLFPALRAVSVDPVVTLRQE